MCMRIPFHARLTHPSCFGGVKACNSWNGGGGGCGWWVAAGEDTKQQQCVHRRPTCVRLLHRNVTEHAQPLQQRTKKPHIKQTNKQNKTNKQY